MMLARENLDKLALEMGHHGKEVHLFPQCHANASLDVLYKNGALRLLCKQCGFEVCQIKVSEVPIEG